MNRVVHPSCLLGSPFVFRFGSRFRFGVRGSEFGSNVNTNVENESSGSVNDDVQVRVNDDVQVA